MNRRSMSMPWIVMTAAVSALALQPQSAAGLLTAFFEALNSDDPGAVTAFYADGATEQFRARRSPEQERAFYERVHSELGRLTVRELRRVSPARAVATLSAEKVEMPVEFAFELAGGKIDGFSVSVGGPPGGREARLQLPPGGGSDELWASLDRRLRELAAADEFSGVVLVAENGEPVFQRGYGQADRGAGRRVAIGTRFDVGSITKMLTKIAIAQLAQAGRLELTDTIARHLPEYPDPDVARKVTIQQLVDHSSGLGDIFNRRWEEADRSRFLEPVDFFALFAGEPLQFEPGERRAYSNAGYVTLGAIVAAVSARPYSEYVAEKIFEPAGMTASGFPARDGSDPEIAVGYTRGGPTGGHTGAVGPLESNLGMLPVRGCPAGSSTHAAADLLKLDRALRSGELLDPEWTAWVFGSPTVEDGSDLQLGVAGGGPGVSAGWESDGALTVIVLANLDPPAGEGLAVELYRSLSERRVP